VCSPYRNPQRALFRRIVRLGNPDAAHRLDREIDAQDVNQGQALPGRQGFDPIDPRRFLALVVLGHAPDG